MPVIKWPLDEAVITIAGQKHWLWRAVDQDGIVLDVLAQSRRDKQAAKRLLRKLLRKQGRPPRVLITDKLASCPVAKKELMPGVEHRRHKGLKHKRTRPYQPRTNGKAERFIQTSLREWAYHQAFASSAERTAAMHP